LFRLLLFDVIFEIVKGTLAPTRVINTMNIDEVKL